MKDELKEATQINKKCLNDIDIKKLFELTEEKLSDNELSSRAGSAHAFSKAYFKKVLTLLIFAQTMKMGKEAETSEQVLYSRGVIKGLQIVEDWFKEQENTAMSKFAPKENLGETIEN